MATSCASSPPGDSPDGRNGRGRIDGFDGIDGRGCADGSDIDSFDQRALRYGRDGNTVR
jgi:hypothetical protein